jgi:hypothetical protein
MKKSDSTKGNIPKSKANSLKKSDLNKQYEE